MKPSAARGKAVTGATMQAGALVFMDALGFKGLWERRDVRADPTKVIRKLERIASEAAAAISDDAGGTIAAKTMKAAQQSMKIAFLSDTVVVSVAEGLGPPLLRHWKADKKLLGRENAAIIALACAFARRVILAMAARPAPLAMRGCVVWGQFAVSRAFLIGPAVDEAATGAGLADAAVLWFAPSATAQFDGLPPEARTPGLLHWDVPLKGGSLVHTRCVAPFDRCSSARERGRIAARILKTFNRPCDAVQIKRRHTERFLDAASRAVALAKSTKNQPEE